MKKIIKMRMIVVIKIRIIMIKKNGGIKREIREKEIRKIWIIKIKRRIRKVKIIIRKRIKRIRRVW